MQTHLQPCRGHLPLLGPRNGPSLVVQHSLTLAPSLARRCIARGFSQRSHSHNWDQSWLSRLKQNKNAAEQTSRASNQNVASVDSPGPASLVGASAKQLLQTAVHSLDMFEPRDTSSVEEESLGMDSMEEFSPHGTPATAHIVKANYEVLRLDEAGAVRRLRIKRRDLLREYGLQPRDLRRIDPTIDFTKTSPSITIKEDVLLLNLGGIRAIVTAEKALLFEPASNNTRKLLDTLVPRLQASAGQRLLAKQHQATAGSQADAHEAELYRREAYQGNPARQLGARAPPFELEVLEGVLMVATGRLDAEVLSVTRRVGELLQKLPRDINPVNLEELRRIKQTLVELENKADTLREMLEQIMDDEDELRELNLSSRPRREERRKQRERDRMERQLTRAREEMEQTRRNSQQDDDDRRGSSNNGSTPHPDGANGSNGTSGRSGSHSISPPGTPQSHWQQQQQQDHRSSGDGTSWGLPVQGFPIQPNLHNPDSSSSRNGNGSNSSRLLGGPYPFAGTAPTPTAAEAAAAARKERLAELYAKHGLRRGPGGVIVPPPGGRDKQQRDDEQQRWRDSPREGSSSRAERDRDRDRDREGDPEEDFQDAQDALEELAEQEEEEAEVEEVCLRVICTIACNSVYSSLHTYDSLLWRNNLLVLHAGPLGVLLWLLKPYGVFSV
eukprot:GHUV01010323.1.p1 GENE.GHUV01010323.1~~GHUV01010323.1.p1  ORF type:complete len:671 (+),score=155.93 GHUV01010323.1:200-2212(+)